MGVVKAVITQPCTLPLERWLGILIITISVLFFYYTFNEIGGRAWPSSSNCYHTRSTLRGLFVDCIYLFGFIYLAKNKLCLYLCGAGGGGGGGGGGGEISFMTELKSC